MNWILVFKHYLLRGDFRWACLESFQEAGSPGQGGLQMYSKRKRIMNAENINTNIKELVNQKTSLISPPLIESH